MVQGIRTFLSGFIFLLSQAGLRAILWKMLGLLTVLMLLLMLGTFYLADYLTHLWLPEDDAWYWQALLWCAWLLAVLMSLVMGVASFTALGSAAVAPWLDILASRTAALMGKEAPVNHDSWLKQSIGSLLNSIRPLFGLAVFAIVALMFFWIPPVATAIWLFASIQFLNFELLDTQASRAGLSFKQRKLQLMDNLWFWLGFGGIAMLLIVIPLVNLLVIPAAVVALAKHDAFGENLCQS